MPICPCCDAPNLSGRQIRRHLATRQRVLEAHLDAMNEDEAGPAPPDDADPAPPNDVGPAPPDDDDIALDDADLDFNDAGPAPRDNSPALSEDQPARWRRIDLAALVAREDEDEDIGKHTYLFTC
jgi:hypothetical protein